MDIIDYIDIPSFDRKRDRLRRGITVLTGSIAIAAALERYNGCISRSLKSARRGLAAAITSWLEDQSGTRLFTLEGDEPPPLTNSALELSALGVSPATWGRNAGPGQRGRRSKEGREGRLATSDALAAAYQAPVVVTLVDEDTAAAAGRAAGTVHGGISRTASNAGQGGVLPDAAVLGLDGVAAAAATPQFFQSTKFFAVLDVDEARELFSATTKVTLRPREVLFTAGESSEAGIFIVTSGQLGVFLPVASGGPPVHTNTLRYGESVGDLDVVDGAPRSVTCIALDEGCTMVQLPRPVFLAFVRSHPQALLLYLQQGLARLWRVAHFMLSDFLALTLHKPPARDAGGALDPSRSGAGGHNGPKPRASAHTQTSQVLPSEVQPSVAAQTSTTSLSLAASGDGSHLGGREGRCFIGPDASSHAKTSLRQRSGDGGGAESLKAGAATGQLPGGARSASGQLLGVSKAQQQQQRPSAEEGQVGAEVPRADALTGSPFAALGTRANGLLQDIEEGTDVEDVSSVPSRPDGGFSSSTALLQEDEQSPAAGKGSAGLSPAASGIASQHTSGLQDGHHSPQVPAGGVDPGHGEAEAGGPRVPSAFAAPAVQGLPAEALPEAAHGRGEQQEEEEDEAAVRAGLQAAADKLRELKEQQDAVLAAAAAEQQKQGGRRGQGRHRPRTAAAKQQPPQQQQQQQEPIPVGPYCRLQHSSTLRHTFEFHQRACLADGWDVVDVEELQLGEQAWTRLADPRQNLASIFRLPRGGVLHEVDWACGQFYLLLDGHLLAERKVPAPPGTAPTAMAFMAAAQNTHAPSPLTQIPPASVSRPSQAGGLAPDTVYVTETGVIRPGSLVSCAAFLSYTAARCRVVALEPARLLMFGWQQLESLCAPAPSLPPFGLSGSGRAASGQLPTQSSGGGERGGVARNMASGGSVIVGKPQQPSASASDVDDVLLPLLVAAAAAMGPLIRRFISLGLNRVWLKSGDVAYRQGDDATCLFVVISGRLRLLHEAVHPVTGRPEARVEEEVGRGEAVGVVWTIAGGQHDTSALCVRDSELVRMSKAAFKIISEDSPMALSRLFSNIARRMMAAWDARMRNPKMSDTIASIPRAPMSGPGASSGASRLDVATYSATPRSDIVTIAIVPAGVMPGRPSMSGAPAPGQRPGAMRAQAPAAVASLLAVKRLSAALKEALVAQLERTQPLGAAAPAAAAAGTTGAASRPAGSSVLVVNSTSMGIRFPVAFERLDVLFYRSKITSWLSSQEEEARFILLEADYHPTPWSSVCVAQADVILLVAAEGARPDMGECEAALVWGAGAPSSMQPAYLRSPSNMSTARMATAAAAISAAATAAGQGQYSAVQATPTNPSQSGAAGTSIISAPAGVTFPVATSPPHTHPAAAAAGTMGAPPAGPPHAPPTAAASGFTGAPTAVTATAAGEGRGGGGGGGGGDVASGVQPPAATTRGSPSFAAAGAAAEGHQWPAPAPTMSQLMHGAHHAASSTTAPQDADASAGFGSPTGGTAGGTPGSGTATSATAAGQLVSPLVMQANAAAAAEASGPQRLPSPLLQTMPSFGAALGPNSTPDTPAAATPSARTAMQYSSPQYNSGRSPQQASYAAFAAHPTSPTHSTPTLTAGVAAQGPGAPAASVPSLPTLGTPPATSIGGAAAAAAAGGVGGIGARPAGAGSTHQVPRLPLPALVRRVELVLLHAKGSQPHDTAGWLQSRPHLARHHHVRLEHDADVARLARWMRGRAVGLVLSGGGSRGLAHLGVLCALEDAGVAVDVVGGTSQGAFMAGLYAQGLGREKLQLAVQQYAQRLGSVRHLLADLTLPLLSVFSGKAFDDTLRKTFDMGAENIEDLWLPYFCVTTNLTRGEPSIHTSGCLWRLVRASMTIVGLLPPVCSDTGDLLVDGGYMNNLPVDVMRGLGVDTVIVVDVESKDDMGWHSLTPYDGGVSGWRLLWDRWCPVPSWRTSLKVPRYAQIVNQLTWMTHAHNLKRVNEDYRIDLYLRPPNIGSFKLMDFHLMERIVKDAYRYASLCLSNWSLLPQVSCHIKGGSSPATSPRASLAYAAHGTTTLLSHASSSLPAARGVYTAASGQPLVVWGNDAAGIIPAGYAAAPTGVPAATGAAGYPSAATFTGAVAMPAGIVASGQVATAAGVGAGLGQGGVLLGSSGGPAYLLGAAASGQLPHGPMAGPGAGTAVSMPVPMPLSLGVSLGPQGSLHPSSSITCMSQLQSKQVELEAHKQHSAASAVAVAAAAAGSGAGLLGGLLHTGPLPCSDVGPLYVPLSALGSTPVPGAIRTAGGMAMSTAVPPQPLSASAASAPPPTAAVIAEQAVARPSFTASNHTGHSHSSGS